MAVGAVVLLTVSGLYLTQLHLGSVDQLLSTPYGRTLLAKLTVMALMVGLGGYHQFIVHPRMVASLDQSDGRRDLVCQRFKRTLRIEAALGLLALLFASSLGTTSPPSGAPAAVIAAFRQARGGRRALGHRGLASTAGAKYRPVDRYRQLRLSSRKGRCRISPGAALVRQLS
jgi:Copper resistance protein D